MDYHFDYVNISTIIFNNNNQVLLCKRSMEEDIYPGLWCVPGGKIDPKNGLEIIEDNLKREVMEEVGIEIIPLFYLSSNCEVGDKNKLYISWVSKHKSGIPKPLEDTEKVAWFDIKKIKRETLTPKTFDNILSASKQISSKH